MCTVSFVPTSEKVVITSNRDEKIARPQSVEVVERVYNHKKVTFPQDPKAGGTWFAVDEFANLAVLLNGAGENHVSKKTYAKSRGLILLDIIGNESPINQWNTLLLENIEPFTVILFQQGELYQLRWNETEKQTVKLNPNKPYIWSSATLYPKEIRLKREEWFAHFLEKETPIDAGKMFDFHSNTNAEDKENGLVIHRPNLVKTFSITQCVITGKEVVAFEHRTIE